MPRIFTLNVISALTVLTLAVAAAPPHAAALNGTPTAPAEHPFVGAWIVDTDTTDDANFPALAVATSDEPTLSLTRTWGSGSDRGRQPGSGLSA